MLNLRIGGQVMDDVELIIFDKDGTIFQLYPFWSRLAKTRANLLHKATGSTDSNLEDDLVRSMGIDIAKGRMFPEGPIGIYPRNFIIQVCQSVLSRHGLANDLELVNKIFREADNEINQEDVLKDSLVPVPGSLEFLIRCKGRCKMAMFSSDTTDRLGTITRMFGIRDCFDQLLGGDLTAHAKPDSWGANHIMSNMKVTNDHACFIGDATVDMICGRSAKMRHLICIRSDISDIEFMNNEGIPIISHFNEIGL